MTLPLDPSVRAVLERAAAIDPRPMETLTVAEARRRGGSIVTVASVPFEDVAEVRDLVVAGGIPARLYRPGEATGALIVYFHGGGWVLGSVALSDALSRALANASRASVLSVEYRLAPEHRYPAAADDAYAATAWAAAHAAELGADVARIGVAGSSAGGNLAAVVALMARDRRGPRLATQLLHVPVLDHDFARPSYRANATGAGLTREGMRWFWDHYCPEVARRAEPYASPLRADDLRGVPDAILVTAECDVLRDEGAAYAERLQAAGVDVRYVEYPGMVHGFLSWASDVPAARVAMRDIGASLRDAFA